MATETPQALATPDHANIVALPPVLYLGALVAGLLTESAVGGAIPGPDLLRWIAGGLAVAAGSVGSVLCTRRFEDAGQDKSPFSPTTTLVTDGLYARSRNPAYVSLTVVYVGLALLLDNPWMLAFLLPVLVLMHYGVILREEHYLALKFGEEYVDYQAKVRRWI
ncbi:MAG: methyltransferase family protein [Myxococcota bacterium]